MLNIQERTIRKLLKNDALIVWNHGDALFGITQPSLELENYPPVLKLLGGTK
jgi:hypothetical protein